jgi:mannose/cellobiose epimerase-like protein (N-acyl-D-glucosamine 2-epimerase family)
MNTNQTRFDSQAFLTQHIQDTLRFYEPTALDDRGGFFHYFKDDGRVYERGHRHLVSATRFVFNWAQAFHHTQNPRYLSWTQHALAHLQRFVLPSGPQQGLSAWTLQDQQLEDRTVFAYGQAFVLLAQAHAHHVGCATAQDVAEAFDRMNAAFWLSEHSAYADEITPEGVLIDYRGQNANMHMCEACLAAHEFTGDERYLQRALQLIERFAFDLADQAQGMVWEHYRPDWSIDWDYNKDNPGNIFKPWGFQTGHQTEWAKLLLIAHQRAPDAALVQRARQLHDAAYQHGWDREHGGLIYGFAPDHRPCDSDKYFWVQAESFASAWRLWRVTQDPQYLAQYQATWQWSWAHLVDHQYGAWFRIVDARGGKLEDTKSPAGKTDYHTMGACWDVMQAGGLAP